MSFLKNIFVLIKQVPDQGSKAGVNLDGTIDRAKARRMLNPFDRYALQAALDAKKNYGGQITAITMGPPLAIEILFEALEHGVDNTILLSDRSLAGSDTWATSYALKKTINYLGEFDLIFCGLQTTDGDTAQVGSQIAERLNIPQITYCEDFKIENEKIIARRVIEGGHQTLKAPLPCLITVANSYKALKYKTIHGAKLVQDIMREEEKKNKYIKILNINDIKANPDFLGIKGSPTIVSKTEKISEISGNCKILKGSKELSLELKEILK